MISCIFALLIALTIIEVVENIQKYRNIIRNDPGNFPGSRFCVEFFPIPQLAREIGNSKDDLLPMLAYLL